MKRTPVSKNVERKNGVIYYKRWTVLDVPEEIVNLVKAYSVEHKVSMGRALEVIIQRSNPKERQVIGLDYWQVISHYRDYFKEFAERMLDAGHQVHIITAVGEQRARTVFKDIDATGVPYTEKHKVVFTDPKESPELKLALCQALGVTVFYDDRDDVSRLLNQHGILAMRVTRKDNSTYDLGDDVKADQS